MYQKYDLIHNFVRLFGMPDTREEQKELIRKKEKRSFRYADEGAKNKAVKEKTVS